MMSTQQTAGYGAGGKGKPGKAYFKKPKPQEDEKTIGMEDTEVPEEKIDTPWDEDMGDDYGAVEESAALGTGVTLGKPNEVPAPKPKKPKEEPGREYYIDDLQKATRTYDDKDPLGNVRIPQLYSYYRDPTSTLEEVKDGVTSAQGEVPINELYQAARDFCGPKVKQSQIDKIVKTNSTDVAIAFELGAANVKNVSTDYLRGIAERGLDIGQYCKFGKSKKLYKAVKVPKVLFGLRAINPPSPAMFVMRFLNFIWRVLGTGIARVPGSFLRVGLAFFKNAGGVTTATRMFGKTKRVYESAFTKAMLNNALKIFDGIAPGLLGAYYGYLRDSKLLATIKAQVRQQKTAERNAILDNFSKEISGPNEAADMFARAIKAASGNIPGDATKDLSDAEVKELLKDFTNGPKKPTLLKPGKYTNIRFGAKKAAVKAAKKEGAKKEVAKKEEPKNEVEAQAEQIGG